jgi:hypothetical protein
MKTRSRIAVMGLGVLAAAVALSLIAVPAASAGVHKYDTRQYLTHEGGTIDPRPGECGGHRKCVFWEGGVHSKVRKCMEGRRVVLFRKRSGADRKLGTARSEHRSGPRRGDAVITAREPRGDVVYARVRPEVHDEFVCRGDRSQLHDDR